MALQRSDSAAWRGAHWIWMTPDGPAKNEHVLFRKPFILTASAARATLRITANTAYDVYVNGNWIGRGPVRSDPQWQYVDAHDVAAHLREGENLLAVHAYGHGAEPVGVLVAFAGPGGLLADLAVDLENGQSARVSTDPTWRAMRAPQYKTDTGFVTRHRQDYKETVDNRLEPVGWESPPYDDRTWAAPRVLGPVPCPPWTRLIPNPLPPSTREPMYPVNVFTHHSGCHYGFSEHDTDAPEALLRDDDNAAALFPLEGDFEVQAILDFGKPVVGRFHLDIADAADGEIAISYGDSLNMTRIDRLRLRPGAQHYQPYERRFGRYVMLTLRNPSAPVKIRRAWFELATYPVEPRGAFECGDAALNRIWDTARWTLRMNMHDHFEDCPFREQMLYCGDLRVAALLAYHAFGDTALARESLLKLARIQREDGVIPNHGYNVHQRPHVIPEYPALWLIALREYWLHSGDAALVAELWPQTRRLLDWYASWEDETGLMRQLPDEMRHDFVDNLAGIPQDGQVLAVQCFYYLALRAAAAMGRQVDDGDGAADCDQRADRLAEAVNASFWDDALGGYRSCLGSNGAGPVRLTPDLPPDVNQPLSQISNGMALYAGIVPTERMERVLALLRDPRRASPARSGYMQYYISEALFQSGNATDAVNRIRNYWGGMIERGATTFWEVFDAATPEGRMPERLWSLCHEFCAGPLHSLPGHVLGVAPLAPGFKRARLAPMPGGLPWAKGRVPTPLGAVEVDWRFDGDAFRMQFTQPGGMELVVEIPWSGKTRRLELDGADHSALQGAEHARIELPAPRETATHTLIMY